MNEAEAGIISITYTFVRAALRAWFASTALGVGSFSIVTAELAPTGLLSPIASNLGVTTATAGLAVTLYAWTAIFAALASAVWLGAAPQRPTLVGLMHILGGSGICAGLAGPFSWLIRIVRFREPYLTNGTEVHRIGDVEVRVYCIAKTIADAFRNPKRVDRSVTIEAMKAALGARKATAGQLATAARENGASNQMRPYLEALTSNR